MFNRNKKDKGKKSMAARMKISQSLRNKAKRLRKQTKNIVSKGVVKVAGATGYAAGRVATNKTTSTLLDKASKPVRKAVSKGYNKLSIKNKDRLMTAESKTVGIANKARKKLNRGTVARASGAFIGGSIKGTYDERKSRY